MYSAGVSQHPAWFDSGNELPLHSELGTRDQGNVVHLDKYEELVWVGTQRGRLLSYLVDFPPPTNDGSHLHVIPHQPYSRFNVDVNEERIVQIMSRIDGIISLTRTNILFNSRGGVSHKNFLSSRAIGRITNNHQNCLSSIESFPHNPVQLAVGSDTAKTLFYTDTVKGELSTFFDLPHAVSKIHSSFDNPLLVTVGGTNGQLSFVEGRSPKVTQTVTAHPYEVTSISSNFNYIFTCGKRDGSRVNSTGGGSPQILVPDVFLKVFDIRNLKHAIPISFPSGAMRVGVTGSSAVGAGGVSLVVLSNYGLWQQGDLYSGSSQLRNCEYFKTNCYAPHHSPDLPASIVDWSVSSDLNAMLDTSGVVHFWVRSEAPFPPRVNHESMGNIVIPPRAPVMPCFPSILNSSNIVGEKVFSQINQTRVYSDTVRDGTWLEWVNQGSEFFDDIMTPLRPPIPVLSVIANNSKEWGNENPPLRYCQNNFGLR